MSALIIPFPQKPPVSCDNCDHAYLGSGGILCEIFLELVNPTVAEECPEFDPIAHGPLTVA